MVKVKPTVTLELESSGQKITIDLQEAKEIIRSLSAFINQSNPAAPKRGRPAKKEKAAQTTSIRKRGRGKNNSSYQIKGLSMSETKRQEIVDHVQKQLSARPKTLSALLKGVSYVPNYLPAIRKMVESRGNIAKEVIGKRTYYSRKSSFSQHIAKHSKSSAIGV